MTFANGTLSKTQSIDDDQIKPAGYPSRRLRKKIMSSNSQTPISISPLSEEEENNERAWSAAGFDDKHEWVLCDFDLLTAQEWRDAGFQPEDAREWLKITDGYMDSTEAKEWSDAGLSPNKWLIWTTDDEFDLAGVNAWDGFSIGDAMDWREAGFEPEDAREWSEYGFYGAGRFGRLPIPAAFVPGSAEKWRDAGFSHYDAACWRELGDIEDAKASIAAGLDFEAAETINLEANHASYWGPDSR
jgi:hypothetical protein